MARSDMERRREGRAAREEIRSDNVVPDAAAALVVGVRHQASDVDPLGLTGAPSTTIPEDILVDGDAAIVMSSFTDRHLFC